MKTQYRRYTEEDLRKIGMQPDEIALLNAHHLQRSGQSSAVQGTPLKKISIITRLLAAIGGFVTFSVITALAAAVFLPLAILPLIPALGSLGYLGYRAKGHCPHCGQYIEVTKRSGGTTCSGCKRPVKIVRYSKLGGRALYPL